MPASPLNVLIIDDNEAEARLIAMELRRAGFEPVMTRVETEADYKASLVSTPDLILSDFNLTQFDALRALKIARDDGHDIPFLVVSGTAGEETAVRAMQSGANDFVLKSRLGRLGLAVTQAIEQQKLRKIERKARQAEAQTSQRLRTTLDSLLEGCQILDSELQYVYLNANAVRHSRQSFDDLIGKRIIDAYPGIEETQLYAMMRRCLEEQIPCDMENRFVFPDGSEGVFDVGILPASDGIVILTYEITERKVDEDELRMSEQRFRESEERYRLALDAAEQGTWQYDYATDEVWFDETCRAHNGVSSTHLKPNEAFAVMSPGDTQQLISDATVALNAVDGDGGFSGEYRIKHADGTVKWLALTAKFQFADSSETRIPRQIHGTTRDITKRKRAETAVHRQSLVLEQIAVGAPLKSVLQEIVDLV